MFPASAPPTDLSLVWALQAPEAGLSQPPLTLLPNLVDTSNCIPHGLRTRPDAAHHFLLLTHFLAWVAGHDCLPAFPLPPAAPR